MPCSAARPLPEAARPWAPLPPEARLNRKSALAPQEDRCPAGCGCSSESWHARQEKKRDAPFEDLRPAGRHTHTHTLSLSLSVCVTLVSSSASISSRRQNNRERGIVHRVERQGRRTRCGGSDLLARSGMPIWGKRFTPSFRSALARVRLLRPTVRPRPDLIDSAGAQPAQLGTLDKIMIRAQERQTRICATILNGRISLARSDGSEARDNMIICIVAAARADSGVSPALTFPVPAPMDGRSAIGMPQT